MNLITLFNLNCDFAVLLKLPHGRTAYLGTTERFATHRLVCTRWNSDGQLSSDVRKRTRELKTRPAGLALSVCAVPLRRKAQRTGTHRLRYRIPPDLWPAYLRKGSVRAKRATLLEFAPAHRSGKKFKKQVNLAGSARCDAIYACLVSANRIAKRRRKKIL